MSRILSIVICFHPDHQRLQCLVDTIHASGSMVLLFDNGGLDASRLNGQGEKFLVESGGQNVGLATPLNFAVDYGVRHDYRLLVSFDQDSTPPVEMIPILERELTAFQTRNPRAIAIGPQLVDLRGDCPVISPFVRFGVLGVEKWTGSGTEPVSQLITSGCMIDLRLWTPECRFNDGLFIDLVDNNWCWRVTRNDFAVLGTGKVQMPHELSEHISTSRVLSLNKYGQFRRYFQMRNAVYHLAHERLSLAQRLYVVRAMVVVFISSIMSDDKPASSVQQCVRGAAHGLIKRLGPFSQ